MVIKESHSDNNYPISAMCDVLEVSKAGYYKWLKNKPTEEQSESDMILQKLSGFTQKPMVFMELEE